MGVTSRVDKLIYNFIENQPTIKIGTELIERYSVEIKKEFIFKDFTNILEKSYIQFEIWLNGLLLIEKAHSDIIAFNFGLFETENYIQVYITGSTGWNEDNDDWASDNDYFPEGNYPELEFYQSLSFVFQDDFELGYFLSIATTIMFVNTFLLNNTFNFLSENVMFATGFDDGNLYNFQKLVK